MNSSASRIGYAGVSTADQNLDARIVVLKAEGCAMNRTEANSGSRLKSRPEPGIIFDFILPGETLAVTRINRLARSLRDLQRIVEKIGERSAHLAATEKPVDTSSEAGKAFFGMLGVFAEFETNLRREHQDQRDCRGQAAGHRPGPHACRGSRAEPCTMQKAMPKRMESRGHEPISAESCRKIMRFVLRAFFQMSIYAASVPLCQTGAQGRSAASDERACRQVGRGNAQGYRRLPFHRRRHRSAQHLAHGLYRLFPPDRIRKLKTVHGDGMQP
ncbi:MAG: recombinase family protein [Rhodospirillaceae bacterium]|nr:recombinase family protein [Rhodospirillaceae bacterium]